MQVLRATGIEAERDTGFGGLLQLLRPALGLLDQLPGAAGRRAGDGARPAVRAGASSGSRSAPRRSACSAASPRTRRCWYCVDDAHLLDAPVGRGRGLRCPTADGRPGGGARDRRAPTSATRSATPGCRRLVLQGLDRVSTRQLVETHSARGCAGRRCSTGCTARPAATRSRCSSWPTTSTTSNESRHRHRSPCPWPWSTRSRHVRTVSVRPPRPCCCWPPRPTATSAWSGPLPRSSTSTSARSGPPRTPASCRCPAGVSCSGTPSSARLCTRGRPPTRGGSCTALWRGPSLTTPESSGPGTCPRLHSGPTRRRRVPASRRPMPRPCAAPTPWPRAAYERAADLSAGADDRARRLVAAGDSAPARGTTGAGGRRRSTGLGPPTDSAAGVEAEELRGRVAARSGSLARARDMLLGAADTASATDADRAVLMLADVVLVCYFLGDAGGALQAAHRLERTAGARNGRSRKGCRHDGSGRRASDRRTRRHRPDPSGHRHARRLRPAGAGPVPDALADARAPLPARAGGRPSSWCTRPCATPAAGLRSAPCHSCSSTSRATTRRPSAGPTPRPATPRPSGWPARPDRPPTWRPRSPVSPG